jgi:hypothetical protein
LCSLFSISRVESAYFNAAGLIPPTSNDDHFSAGNIICDQERQALPSSHAFQASDPQAPRRPHDEAIMMEAAQSHAHRPCFGGLEEAARWVNKYINGYLYVDLTKVNTKFFVRRLVLMLAAAP